VTISGGGGRYIPEEELEVLVNASDVNAAEGFANSAVMEAV